MKIPAPILVTVILLSTLAGVLWIFPEPINKSTCERCNQFQARWAGRTAAEVTAELGDPSIMYSESHMEGSKHVSTQWMRYKNAFFSIEPKSTLNNYSGKVIKAELMDHKHSRESPLKRKLRQEGEFSIGEK